MANQIPGVTRRVQPNVFTRIRTRQRVNAVAGGVRDVAIIGEGEREEIVIAEALGAGADGVNADFSGVDTPDGRHYQLTNVGLVAGRSSLRKNGVPLTIKEETITALPFDNRFDARIETATGRIELQTAHLVDQGGDNSSTQYWTPGPSNVGTGNPVLTAASLVDANAPAETWTARVTGVILDGSGDPISGEATISVSGSVSGIIHDSDGNPILWKSDGVVVSNTVLNFSFTEGGTPYNVGDRFTIVVDSGVLSEGDELSWLGILTLDVNDPELFATPAELFAKHGDPSTANSLSLGAQMAFENGAPRVLALQAKPSVPRKTSQTLIASDDLLTTAVEGASGGIDVEDTIFALPIGELPHTDSNVNVYVIETDGSENQLVLNRQDFYDATYTSLSTAYSGFVTDAGTVNSYTVFTAAETEQSGNDGYVTVTTSGGGGVAEILFTSPTVAFSADRLATGEGDVGKQIEILAPDQLAGTAPATHTYTITSVGDGYGDMTVATATSDAGGPTITLDGYSDVEWAIVDSADTSQYFAITDDVALVQLTAGKGLRIEYIHNPDFDYFDTNWSSAYENLERVDTQFVVPLPQATYSNIFAAGKVHAEKMSQTVNARERVLLVGSFPGLEPDNLIGRTLAAVENVGVLEGIQGDSAEEVLAGNIEDLADYDVAAAYGDTFRTVWVHPDEVVRNIAGTNTTLPGFYMAAALGGFLAGQGNIAEPPTYKTLSGFNILRDKVYRQITLDELADAGVLVVQPVSAGGQMLHGLTTIQSGAPEEEEISIVGIRDLVARVLRNSLRPFVGKVNSPTIVAEISGGVDKLLRGLVPNLLTGVGAITVARNPLEPRQIDIEVEINPVGPINWIFVDVTVSL
jgi:hypothetical protein